MVDTIGRVTPAGRPYEDVVPSREHPDPGEVGV